MTQTLPQHVTNPLTGAEYAPSGAECRCPQCEGIRAGLDLIDPEFPVPRRVETKPDRSALRRVRQELRPAKDEASVDDTLYWLRKVRDRVADVAKDNYELDSPANEPLLDAENATEDVIYEYRQAWELAKARQSNDMCDDRR